MSFFAYGDLIEIKPGTRFVSIVPLFTQDGGSGDEYVAQPVGTLATFEALLGDYVRIRIAGKLQPMRPKDFRECFTFASASEAALAK